MLGKKYRFRADLQRVMSYVKGHEQEFIRTATECSEQAMKKALGHQRKELDKVEAAPAFRLPFGDTFYSRNPRRTAARKTGRFHQTW